MWKSDQEHCPVGIVLHGDGFINKGTPIHAMGGSLSTAPDAPIRLLCPERYEDALTPLIKISTPAKKSDLVRLHRFSHG